MVEIKQKEQKQTSNFEQVAQGLYDLWHQFELAGRTAEAMTRREEERQKLHQSFTPEVSNYLAELIPCEDGVTRSRGQSIQLSAVREAQAERNRQVVLKRVEASNKIPVSEGEKLHERRVKAQVRRGTNPNLIH
ncbi:hypothetical protein HY404_03450 [Candidatus Microgenomates bacterium]|nr:hypothetical protein [Candidatus Microgenomates bacterium]